LELLTIALLC